MTNATNYTAEQLLENPKLFRGITDEQFNEIFIIVTDIFVCMDMIEYGFTCLCKAPSVMNEGETVYLFHNTKNIRRILATYPSHTYLQ